MPILTFYTPQHRLHAPPMEQWHGRTVPYFESPRRIDVLRDALMAEGLLDIREPQALIPLEELAKTHTQTYLYDLQYVSENAAERVRASLNVYKIAHLIGDDEYYYETMFPPCLKGLTRRDEGRHGFFAFDNTAPVGTGTWRAVIHSASLAYAGAKAILDGEQAVYAMCRPPGHHAGADFAGGYCFLNNAGVAANALRQRGKVAILDIDYHHGNGTQAIFWDDPDVLYISIHADPTVEYPYYAGHADEIGGEAAQGFNVNFPLPFGADEATYFATLEKAFDHIRDFAPSSLVISLGFDTYKDDPMARFELTLPSYETLGQRIAGLGLPTLYVQEGGYYLEDLGRMAVHFFKGVIGV